MRIRIKKNLLFCLLSGLVVSFACLSHAAKPKSQTPEAYKSYKEIPEFLDFVEGEPMELYTQRLLDKIMTFLEHTSEPIQYVDENHSVTRKNLEKYIRLVGEEIVRIQKIKFAEIDTNKDKIYTFEELSKTTKISEKNLSELYQILSEHREWAVDKIEVSLQKIHKDGIDAPETWLFSQWMIPWLRLDRNKDQIISNSEINTPDERELKEKIENATRVFEQYLSLSKDGKSVSFETINAAAVKSFKTLDRDGDKAISSEEYSLYVRKYLGLKSFYDEIKQNREQCGVPSLKDESGPTYVVHTLGSEAITPVVYYTFGRHYNNASYTEVNIEKQSVPINLVLSAEGPRIWGFTGDIQSISKVIILGASDYSEIDGSKHYLSGVLGVPKEKVTFSSSYSCLGQIKRSTLIEPPPVRKEREEHIRAILSLLLDTRPYLVQSVSNATHILIKSNPEIAIDTSALSGTKDLPPGFKKIYWKKFLQTVPQGLKKIDYRKLVSGGYSVEGKIFPGWAGLAELERLGIISELKIDEKNYRAVFLLKKNLPDTPANIPGAITLILENENLESLKFGYSVKGSSFCVMNKEGKLIHGISHSCSVSDISLLNPEKSVPPAVGPTVYLKLRKYIPVYPSYKDSIAIKFEIDEKRCRKEYADGYKEECKIPKELSKTKIPMNAVSTFPEMFGQSSWKNEETITYLPSKPWSEQGDNFELTVDLDALFAPSNILLNGQRKAKTKFMTAYHVLELSDVNIATEESDDTKKRLTANIKTNYPIGEFNNFTFFNVPNGAVMPDESSPATDTYISLNYEEPWDDVSFEMTEETSGRISVIFPPDKRNLFPTHLLISPTSTQAYVQGFHSGHWFDLRDEKNPKYPEKIKNLIDRAREGDASAQLALGKEYDKGQSLPKSLAKARYWLKKSAEHGAPEAFLAYGRFAFIKYPAKGISSDIGESYFWLMKAAESNLAEAQYLLGVMQSDERTGFRDYTESLSWLKRATDQNYLPAVLYLAKQYEQGRGGLKINTSKAMQLYKKAAGMGSLEAEALIARMHFFGLGRAQDMALGYKLARQVMSKAKREDFAVRDIAARLIADTLLMKSRIDQTQNEAERIQKNNSVAEKIMKEFPSALERLWIVHQLPSMRYSITQTEKTNDLDIARAVVREQEIETPDLPEIRLLKAKILLQEGYLYQQESFSRYKAPYLEKAISFLEEIRYEKVLEKEVFTLLMECYLSNDDLTGALKLLNSAMFERYYTNLEIGRGAARYAEYTDNPGSAAYYYEELDDQDGLARASFQISGQTDKLEKTLIRKIKENPQSKRAYERYGWFLLLEIGDYEKAINMSSKSLKLGDTYFARQLGGLALIVKASQLNKTEGLSENVTNYINTAHLMGLTSWTVASQCRSFCQDINVLYDEYYSKLLEKAEGERTKLESGEIENIKAETKGKADPI